ncbi:hypothetical protein NC651_038130, partial [Populus alba x Populus x berolinensis]
KLGGEANSFGYSITSEKAKGIAAEELASSLHSIPSSESLLPYDWIVEGSPFQVLEKVMKLRRGKGEGGRGREGWKGEVGWQLERRKVI